MRVLVTGSRGQLGTELIKQFNSLKGRPALIETDLHNLDIANQKEVLSMLTSEKPNVIINCAAYTNVDKCESDEFNAFKVNAIGAQNLSIGANKIRASIVQISTDYVFDGLGNTPKREYDETNPLSCYGKSKAFGEKLVREANPRHYILRTAWLYGDGNNFVKTMLRLAKEQKNISVVNDQYGSPTSTKDLATAIINLINTEHYGTYHATCEGECSWYDFAYKIFKLKGMDINLNSITTEELNRPAQRPKYAVLDNFMLKLIGMNSFRNWEEALIDYIDREESE